MTYDRLKRLSERRIDVMIKEAKLQNEVYYGLNQSEAVKYAIGCMQPIDPVYILKIHIMRVNV